MNDPIKNFFIKDLMPISKNIGIEGTNYIECRPNPDEETYYKTPINHGKTYYSFLSSETKESLEAEFERLWHSMGESELVHLSPVIAKIALEIKLEPKQAAEVSDFVYIMH